MMKPVLDAFQEENPDIKLEVSYGTPVDGYVQTLQTRLGSGTAADVFIITAENKQAIMDGGFAKDLSSQPWIDNIAQAARDTYTTDGKVYGAAVASWGGGILYNQDLLAEVGATEPPATWDEFLDLCKKLKDAGIAPIYDGGSGISVILAALLGLENQALGGDMDAQIWAGETTFEETWTDAVTEWYRLFTEDLVPTTVTGLTGDQVTSEFQTGQVAMITTGSWALGSVQAGAPDLKLGFWPIAGASESYWAGAVSPGYAINAKTEHEEAAETFVEFLQSKEGVELYQQQNQSITTTADYAPELNPALDLMAADVREGRFYLPQVSWVTDSAALNSEVGAQLQRLILGEIEPADVGAALDAKLASLQ